MFDFIAKSVIATLHASIVAPELGLTKKPYRPVVHWPRSGAASGFSKSPMPRTVPDFAHENPLKQGTPSEGCLRVVRAAENDVNGCLKGEVSCGGGDGNFHESAAVLAKILFRNGLGA